MLHHPDFELLGAEARHRVGKIPVLADQGLEGLAVAAGAIIANDVKPIGRSYACTVIVGAFQPPNMDAPANAAFMDEAKRFFALFSGVGEDDDDIIRQHAAVGPTNPVTHVCPGPAADEAKQNRKDGG